MKIRIYQSIVFPAILLLAGCGLGAPESFMQMNRQYWESMDVKSTIKYEDAWQRVIYIITKKFELEMISKEDGYVRSSYGQSYFTEDIQNERYQIRIVAKFNPDRKKFEFKIESRVWDGKIWHNGSDVRVAANMRKDFLNSLGEPQAKKQIPSQQTAPTDSLQAQ
ncbi:MAG: hypothetical protein KA247_10580 [Bacteroidetes bacterium]|jgi:hypothetical protein|nr:hypothetical protein [Bacteroidota bacterium]